MTEEFIFHVWFATKRRRWLLVGEVEEAIKTILWEIAKDKGIDLLECETMVDHVPLLVRAQSEELPRMMHALKGAASRRVSQRFPELRLDGAVPSLWQRSYKAEAVPNEAAGRVAAYIKTQRERLDAFDRPYRRGQLV